jgi:exosortase
VGSSSGDTRPGDTTSSKAYSPEDSSRYGAGSDSMGSAPTTASARQTREWLLVGILAAAFAPALMSLARVWASVDYLSHGFLVPVVAFWAFSRERPRRKKIEAIPDRRGLALLGLALTVYLLGLASGSITLQGLALVAAVAGLALYCRGGRWLRAVAFPVAFLIFMVPPPSSVVTPVIVQLQLYVSRASAALLEAFSVHVARDGNVLTLPGGGSLFIAEACSGITSIATLAPLALLLARYTLKRGDLRILLFVSALPLAMLGNLARVVATVLVSIEIGIERATSGPPHEALGLLTYLVACSLMLALTALLRRVESSGRSI